jgi:uncharacterized membrane protein
MPGDKDPRIELTPWLTLAVLVVVAAAAYSAVGIFKHWHFDSSYDLGIFNQATWHLSRFEIPGSTISGHQNILGDHFYPIVFLFVLPYWIVPLPETLIVAQAILIAASIVPVFFFLRRRLSISLSVGLVIAYAVFWGIQRAINADVHEMAFAPLIIACAVLAMDQKRWGWLWVCCLILMGTKEDLIPLVAGIGAYVFMFAQDGRRQGVSLAAFALLGFLVVVNLIIPSFSGGWGSGGAYRAVWERPWTAPAVLITPPQKLLTVVFWLAPFCFLTLRSPLALLVIPIAVERLLSSISSHWGWGGHYTLPLAPLLAMSAGDGLYRLTRNQTIPILRWPGLRSTLVTLSVIFSLIIPGHQPIFRLFSAGHYRIAAGRGEAAEALGLIPLDASVVAQASLLPHLSKRAKIFVLDTAAPDADYVIASLNLNPWPLSDRSEIADLIQQRRAQNYVTIFDQAGWVVLKGRSASR